MNDRKTEKELLYEVAGLGPFDPVGRGGQTVASAIKLYFSQTNPLDENSGMYVATTVHQFIDSYVTETTAADYRRCQVIDVFGGEIYTALRSFVRRRNDIEAACEEIARAWPEQGQERVGSLWLTGDVSFGSSSCLDADGSPAAALRTTC